MNSEIQIAIIGVIGTLSGTVLGWVLNSISQNGKLNFYVTSWKEDFTYTGLWGDSPPSSSIEESESFHYVLKLDIYNSSSIPVILREIKVVFQDKNNIVWETIPYDESTKRWASSFYSYEEISPVNVPAKTVKTLGLTGHANVRDSALNEIWNTTGVYLSYIDQKNRSKEIQIKKVEYKNYFM